MTSMPMTNMPIYVTRETADGYTGSLELPFEVAIPLLWLIVLTGFAWMIVAIVTAVSIIVGWF